MDFYKEKFTKVEREILRFLFVNAGRNYNQREIAIALKVSPTAVANSVKKLEKAGLLEVTERKETKPFAIGLNFNNKKVFFAKRVENLRMIYESGLVEYLGDKFPQATIILFGSYSSGEDVYSSDIDIAVIGVFEKDIDLNVYEKIFMKKIAIQFYSTFGGIHKNLKESILNGILIKGSVWL